MVYILFSLFFHSFLHLGFSPRSSNIRERNTPVKEVKKVKDGGHQAIDSQ